MSLLNGGHGYLATGKSLFLIPKHRFKTGPEETFAITFNLHNSQLLIFTKRRKILLYGFFKMMPSFYSFDKQLSSAVAYISVAFNTWQMTLVFSLSPLACEPAMLYSDATWNARCNQPRARDHRCKDINRGAHALSVATLAKTSIQDI